MDELPAANDLKYMLPLNWWQEKENPNKFFSNFGQAIYVYNDKIKFWPDIRCVEVIEKKLPVKSQEIQKLIKQQ